MNKCYTCSGPRTNELIQTKTATPNGVQFDYIIIGSGLVGLYLCNLLITRFPDINICLLERGGLSMQFAESTLKTKNFSHSAASSGRIFGFGGTSRIWGGQLSEFDQSDFEKWPIAYEEIKQWYGEVYSLLDCSPPKEGSIPKQDFLLNSQMSFFYTAWMKNPDFSKVFSGLLSSPNVTVLLHKTVDKLLFDDGAICIGCEFHDSQDTYKLFGKHTIITAGVFQSIKIVSSIDSPHFPQSARSEVGIFFQDHIGGVLSTVRIVDRKKFQQLFENRFINGTKIQPKIKSRYAINQNQVSISGFFSNVSIVDEYIEDLKSLCRYFNFKKNRKKRYAKKDIIQILKEQEAGESIGDICRRYKIGPPTLLQWQAEFSGNKIANAHAKSGVGTFFESVNVFSTFCRMIFKLIVEKRIHSFFGSVRFHFQCEQIPIRSSKVVVDDDQIYLDWQIDGREIEVISRFQDDVDEFLIENKLGSLDFKKNLKTIDDLDHYDTAHASGGLRMADVDANGVVNPDLSLKGLKNLSCISSAVFPSSSQANVTLTILALCHKFVAQQQISKNPYKGGDDWSRD